MGRTKQKSETRSVGRPLGVPETPLEMINNPPMPAKTRSQMGRPEGAAGAGYVPIREAIERMKVGQGVVVPMGHNTRQYANVAASRLGVKIVTSRSHTVRDLQKNPRLPNTLTIKRVK